ncbi:uncharacterized protein LOC143430689 [Xylocopa sonorina]|uniref:uncharacterized protein LOC143430689 n=1 Tax=Xylocopa sonorina TaxID=1818115 RepID=UPI00403B1F45
MPTTLPALCVVTLVLCNVHGSLEHGIPRRSFLSRRAIDGTRGRKYFDPEDEGAFDSYGSAGGQYDPYQEKTDLSDIRRNVPGEPGIDYPAYTTLPQTGFTCEGRSRGYYADEVAGCQVFHVCHDVLVSSFLCPIGSTFSQKLLTCDWWTKVDCSASGKYIDVNRNSYQQDDDEMIRNAYAMISLQSGTDVTKDGLVDPDRTGIVVDYQRSPPPIIDYSPVDANGNDLKANFEDYPRPVSRDFLPPYQLKGKKFEHSRNYQEKFYPGDKSGSPYEDSPIVRVQKINDPQRKKNEFTDQFQPSYAPTVPTVTTTTRRFYSPTVPTTFRPSTLAYNKLDQVIDSSDYYFSRSRTKSFVTPPTRVFSNDDDHSFRQESYEDDYEDSDSEESRSLGQSRERFQVRVADFDSNRTGALNGTSPLSAVYRNDGTVDEFETRGSIGLGQALRQSFREISVQDQNPANHETKEQFEQSIEPPSADSYKTGEPRQRETTERYQRNDQREKKADREEISGDATNVFNVPSTTPSVIESTIKASTTSTRDTLGSSVSLNGPSDRYNETNVDPELSNDPHTSRPAELLKPLEKTKFQIKVPDLSEVPSLLIRYSTLHDGPYSGTKSTYSDEYVEQPSTSSPDENLGATSNHANAGPSGDPEQLDNYFNLNSGETDVEQRTANYSSGVSSTVKPFEENSSESTWRAVTPRNAEEPKIESEKSDIEASTAVNAFFGSIRPETLKQIEETIEKNNSPYQVTLTVNKGEDLVPSGEDLISKLVAQHGKETSTLNDKEHRLEVIKSVEPEIHRMPEVVGEMEKMDTTAMRTAVENGDQSRLFGNDSTNTVSLLQLMSELLKLDRVPRPFSIAGTLVAAEPKSHSRVERIDPRESSTFLPRSKEEILGELAQNFGQPVYGKEGGPETTEATTASTVLATTSTPKTLATLTTESAKTVVKTEFLPSIGFSLDTDEGREEYVEAVLGGLIEPQTAESEKKETILKRNETLGKI